MLFTFPSRYLFAIGHARVLRLGAWSPHVQTGFHVSRLTRGRWFALRIRGCHPLWPAFPDSSACLTIATGLVRVRSPLLAESLLMSFPTGTEMFQFPAFASFSYVFRKRYPVLMLGNDSGRCRPLSFSKHPGWVSPFGNPRIKGYSHLPVAYRSLSRPSSPVHAKASTNCP